MQQRKRPMKVRYNKLFETEEQIEAYMRENPTHMRMNHDCYTGLRSHKRPQYISVMFEYVEEVE